MKYVSATLLFAIVGKSTCEVGPSVLKYHFLFIYVCVTGKVFYNVILFYVVHVNMRKLGLVWGICTNKKKKICIENML